MTDMHREGFDRKVSVSLGALAPPISAQVASLSEDDGRILDLDADAISRLHVRGLITDSAAHSARKKLMKNIQAAMRYRDEQEKGDGKG